MSTRKKVLSEIAPAGVIRAAVNMSNAALVHWDDQAGALVGPSARIGHQIAEQLDRGVSLIQYGSAADILAAADRGEWDIAFIASDPSRADRFSFSPPYISVRATYLVPEDSAFRTVGDVDAEGVRIASARSAAYTKQLERILEEATVSLTDSPAAAIDLLVGSQCDAAAGLTEFLVRTSERISGFRLVEGAFSEIPQTIAVHRISIYASAFFADFVRRLDETAAGDVHMAGDGEENLP
ncbi:MULTISPECIES: transporter substrate-binding domain-containing protein [unclassified Rhizobium]|uniref:transporter substrate-binding domain-containing protein n=1 Tax=unclassified Rhizobium TaxID=2613769 RepID=UPI001C82F1E5|nr:MULTISPECIES: transporter substrate-binding domain-containing protein [unclassified Rhizobium]MBX5216696.1 transporter substrate-binding domain-containing protein [Rhizobium sp. NLR9a]MBX5247183.1 transporter substrate-binding domain-containing protein [Rhizobium sp. NLR3b]MBX5277997.1 transporter substrate-binding domain-containing protein [Rhizobium sp. NLR13a]MBX5283867.1 transporter substrate-binding domain-containing protein [Rhizobium sp. NLR10a]MBX5295530.1 transporter substrate-bind